MSGIKVEEAKKELEGIVSKAKQSVMSEDDKKKAQEALQKAEEQAKKDAELLSKKDEEITEEAEKKRKQELLEQQRKEEDAKLSNEDRIKKVKDESQKRIDEIVNELKEIKDKSSKEAESLKREVENLRKEKEDLAKKISQPKPEEDTAQIVEKEEKERITKYLQEDSSKPKEQRREMSENDLEEWLLEDLKSAVAWINRREFRRAQEKNQSFRTKESETKIRSILEKQVQSFNRGLVKHPELDIKKRQDELKAQGKSENEIESTLRQENKKYNLVLEISEKHPEWRLVENGPELVVAEMEKQLNDSQESVKSESEKKMEELSKQVENLTAEIGRLTSTDEGINSTLLRTKENKQKLSDAEQSMISTMKENGATQDMIDSALKKFRARQQK